MPKLKTQVGQLVRLVESKKKSKRDAVPNVEDLEDVELEGDDISEDELEASEKVSDFQERFSGKQYKVRIERFNQTEAEWEWIAKLPLDGFDPFNVLPRYGGGKYKAVLLNDEGRYVKGGMMNFRFSAPLEIPKDERPRSALEDPTVIMMLEQQKSHQLALMEILKSSMPAQAANVPKPLDMAQMMEIILKVQTLTAPKENNVKSLMDMLSLVEKARDTLAPDEKEGGGIVSEIKEAIGALALLPQIRNQMSPVQPPQVRVISPTAPVVINPAKEPKPKVNDKPVSPAASKALFYVPKFEDAARENQPAQKWAEKLLDILDEEVIPALVSEYNGFVSQDSIYDRLLAGAKGEERETVFIHAPALLPYKEWVYSVIAQAVSILESPDPDENDIPQGVSSD